MVLPDSHGVSRAPRYSGTRPGVRHLSLTGLSPTTVGLSRPVLLDNGFLTPGEPCRIPETGPTTPDEQRRQPITSIQFRLFPVRSPLLGESRLISIPRATEMFHFARLPT